MKGNRPMKINRKSFTIIELLIVISVISILICILLPVLSRARDKAKAIFCVNNLKQCGLAINSYAGDYGGYVAVRQYETWGYANNWAYFMYFQRYLPVDSTFCPMLAVRQNVYVNNIQADWGRCYGIWDIAVGNYIGDQGWSGNWYGMRSKIGEILFIHNSSCKYWVLHKAKASSQTVVLADAALRSADGTVKSLAFWQSQGTVSRKGSGGIYTVHGGRANTLYLDGHVSANSAADLARGIQKIKYTLNQYGIPQTL